MARLEDIPEPTRRIRCQPRGEVREQPDRIATIKVRSVAGIEITLHRQPLGQDHSVFQ